MKQIENRYICKYCLGCVAEEQESFIPKQRCKSFVPGQADWQEKWRKEQKTN